MNTLRFEQDDEDYYILEGNDLYGLIHSQGRDNFYIVWNDDDIKIPEHGLDNAIRYVRKHYKEHKPI